MKNDHGGVLLLVKLLKAWIFFTFFKLHNWYQFAQTTHMTFKYQKFEVQQVFDKPLNKNLDGRLENKIILRRLSLF